MTEIYVAPLSYRVTIIPEACLEGSCPAGPYNDLHHWTLEVQRMARGDWRVTDRFQVLMRDGTWGYPSPPDNPDHPDGEPTEARRRKWRALYAYGSVDEALEAAREAAPGVTINGLRATEVLARHLARHGENGT